MQVPYTNRTQRTQHIGGKMVRPGETRPIEESLLRKPKAPATQSAPDPDAELRGILEHPAKGIPALLGGLAAEELDRVDALEHEGKARKTVFEAVAEQKLELAKQSTSGTSTGHEEITQDYLREHVKTLDDEGLDDLRAAYEDGSDEAAIVDAETQRRQDEAANSGGAE